MSHSFCIQVDLDKCVGSRICVAIAPKVFRLSEDGQASVVDAGGDIIGNIRMAEEACPVSAIAVKEVDEEPTP
jgi:ferredoxin